MKSRLVVQSTVSIAVLDYLWLKGSEQQNMLTCFLQNSCNTHFLFFLQVDDASVLLCLFLLKQDRLGRTDCSEKTVVTHTDWTVQYWFESLYPPCSYFIQVSTPPFFKANSTPQKNI